MKFSYNWLKDFLEIKEKKKQKFPTPEEILKKISIHSFELDGVDYIYDKKNNLTDVLLNLDILPNRSSDSYSYVGIAREISALFDNLEFHKNISDFIGDKNIDVNEYINLKIDTDYKLIKRATKRIAIDVNIQESPEWLKTKLESIGQRSINNIVDITNYVMWVTGQPVHAFDYDKIFGNQKQKKILIRNAKKGEKIQVLSGEIYELDNDILVISDSEKALDIAGIKGGINSGVDENTKRIILSGVNFDFKQIRDTSKKIKLRTDASVRYENEVPICRLDDAMNLFANLIQDLADAKVSDNLIDTLQKREKKKKIELKYQKIKSLLGFEIEKDQIIKILNNLNIKTEFNLEKEVFISEIPCDRLDLKIPEDLIEEVVRIYGYHKIPVKMPEGEIDFRQKSEIKENFYTVLDYLISQGFYEVKNRIIIDKGIIELKNPYNKNAAFLRVNLIDNLKMKVQKEILNSDNDLKIFEFGKVFESYELDSETEKENKIVNEYWSFSGIIGQKKIKEKQKEDLFYQIKGYLEMIFDLLKIEGVEWKESQENKNEILAELWDKNEQKIGEVGVNFWEINFEKLLKNKRKDIESYKTISKYPKIKRDLAFWVSEDYTVKEAEDILKKESKNMKNLISFELFDIYKDKENKRKSFAFKFIFQSFERTLTDEEINQEMNKIYSLLEKKGFSVR